MFVHEKTKRRGYNLGLIERCARPFIDVRVRGSGDSADDGIAIALSCSVRITGGIARRITVANTCAGSEHHLANESFGVYIPLE